MRRPSELVIGHAPEHFARRTRFLFDLREYGTDQRHSNPPMIRLANISPDRAMESRHSCLPLSLQTSRSQTRVCALSTSSRGLVAHRAGHDRTTPRVVSERHPAFALRFSRYVDEIELSALHLLIATAQR